MPSHRPLWFFSAEPEDYSWDDLFRDGRVRWDGIRGTAARKWLRSVSAGDRIWGYHATPEKAVVAVVRAAGAPYPDPSDDRWLAIDLQPVRRLKKTVPLARMREIRSLRNMKFLRMPRLSVSPVSPTESTTLARLSGTRVP